MQSSFEKWLTAFLVAVIFCAFSDKIACQVWAGQDLPRVVILATGGTIAGTGTSPDQTTQYKAGVVDIDALIKSVPGLSTVARISGRQVANIDSAYITNDILLKLAVLVNEIFRSGDADGVVITHGTDTMEETAYFLNMLVKSDKPVVMTGSMRPATAMSADGPLNLLNAVILAAHPAARGRGVLVMMNEKIHGARDVAKTHTTNVDTFQSPEFGSLGYVLDGRPQFVRTTVKRHTKTAEFDVGALKNLPRVDILYGHGHGSRELVDAAVGAKARGIVYAGVGDGGIFPSTYRALQDARKKGVVVVRASRVGSGAVAAQPEDRTDGIVTANTLNPQKARILLMLGLTITDDPQAIQRMFDEY